LCFNANPLPASPASVNGSSWALVAAFAGEAVYKGI
jgi:hypothetical protein